MLIVNFKAYGRASGEEARKLAETISEVERETGKRIVAVPQPCDLLRVRETGAECFAQHLDPVEPGSHTGSILPEAVKETGATGTLINHSEKRLDDSEIKRSVARAGEIGLETVVCARDPEEVEKYSEFGPDYVAFEPPGLIGGDVSVASAKPGLIEDAVERSQVPVLTGAGIHSMEDVDKSRELGTPGVLVASAIVKAENRREKIMELCDGL